MDKKVVFPLFREVVLLEEVFHEEGEFSMSSVVGVQSVGCRSLLCSSIVEWGVGSLFFGIKAGRPSDTSNAELRHNRCVDVIVLMKGGCLQIRIFYKFLKKG